VIEEVREEGEGRIEEGSGGSTKEVVEGEDAAAHPSFEMGRKKVNTDHVTDQVGSIGMEELEGEDAPDLEIVEGQVDTEKSPQGQR
jgi:hypothetical protein